MPLAFSVTITEGRSQKSFTVRHKPMNDREEFFIIERENERYLVNSNRPLIRKYAKKRRPDFKISSDKIRTWSFDQKLMDALWDQVKKLEASNSL